MSVLSKLAYLDDTKAAIRNAIQTKGVAVPASTTFRQYADKIRLIETNVAPPSVDPMLEEITVSGASADSVILPSTGYDGISKVTVSGDVNLKPSNIAYGVEIYGVIGTATPRGNVSTTVPEIYQPTFEHAKTLYDGEYKHLIVLESNEAVGIGFLLDGFQVTEYTMFNSEFEAKNWVYVAHNKQTDKWKVEDWSNGKTSNGGSYIKNIRVSTTYIYYNDTVLYPTIFTPPSV